MRDSTPSGTLAGDATYIQNDAVQLTGTSTSQQGLYYWQGILGYSWEASFEFKAQGGSGADAVWFFAYRETDDLHPESNPSTGYNFAADEYNANTYQVHAPGLSTSIASGETLDDGQWRKMKIVFSSDGTIDTFKLYVNGTLFIDSTHTATTPLNYTQSTYYGFGGRTGGKTNNHFIRNFLLRDTQAVGSVFYVNNQYVGEVDRVGCGTQLSMFGTYLTGQATDEPGHVAVAGIFNRILNQKEITKVHRLLERWGQGQYVQKIPKSVGFAKNTFIKIWQIDELIPPLGASNTQIDVSSLSIPLSNFIGQLRKNTDGQGYLKIDSLNPDPKQFSAAFDERLQYYPEHSSFDFADFGYYIIPPFQPNGLEFKINIPSSGVYIWRFKSVAIQGNTDSFFLEGDDISFPDDGGVTLLNKSLLRIIGHWHSVKINVSSPGIKTFKISSREPSGLCATKLTNI